MSEHLNKSLYFQRLATKMCIESVLQAVTLWQATWYYLTAASN